jgi:hypothetical protein
MSQDTSRGEKLDYLKAIYVFRYPFTVKAIRWGGIIGAFIALHTFIKQRSAKRSFEAFLWGAGLSSFPIWAFFMAKYNFYEDSISEYEKGEEDKIIEADAIMKNIEYMLKLPSPHDLN